MADKTNVTHLEVHARYAMEVPGPAPVTLGLHQRPLRGVYEILYEAIKASGWDDEYFSSCWKWDADDSARHKKEIEERGFPMLTDRTKLEDVRYRWICVFATTGGSEGHYTHVDLIWQNNYREGRVPLFLYKTFAGLEQAISVAALLSRALEV